MKCSKCKEKSVFEKPSLCKKHFIQYFENKVKKMIKEFKLIKEKEKICVAVSGGKDLPRQGHSWNGGGYDQERWHRTRHVGYPSTGARLAFPKLIRQ